MSSDTAEMVAESSRRARSPAGQRSDSAFRFSCRCLNVTVHTTTPVDKIEILDGSSEVVKLGEGAEVVKHSAYVGYDLPPPERRTRRGSLIPNDVEPQPQEAWRTCFLCRVKLYRASIAKRTDPPVQGEVNIDRKSGILFGETLESALQSKSFLPYSILQLTPPSSSNFGRPPQATLTTLYPPTAPTETRHLPQMHDPFFLPPPFIPSHPHLRQLCSDAVSFLSVSHQMAEDDVKEYIAQKSRELIDLEEKVRAEVEVMWERYMDGPGKYEFPEESRSSSVTRSNDRKGKKSQRTQSQSPEISSSQVENPILREAAVQPAYTGGSLLSASISQMSYMPLPPPVPVAVDDNIEELTKKVGTRGDERAVAMSYVFNSLDDAMADKVANDRRRRRKSVDETVEKKDLHGKDSWIDEERNLVMRHSTQTPVKEEEEEEDTSGRTPRIRTIKELSPSHRKASLPSGEGKGKGKVKFEEPEIHASQREREKVAESMEGDFNEEEDYVFEFELEDEPKPELPPPEQSNLPDALKSPAHPSVATARAKQDFADALTSSYASQMPSHRIAARRQQGKLPELFNPHLRRNMSDDGEEGNLSKLATSVPLAIATPSRPARGPHPLERKTSLTERQGVLVPPLRLAMRQSSIAVPAPPTSTLGLVVSRERRGSRSASASRERDNVRTFNADPGPVFETLADEVEEDGTDDDGLEEGTFVPPHVLARKESKQTQDVGWRSMVTE